ncbi:hypothetical protein SAMN05660706_13829 [Desulfoscipio geothermicus DSM 3669]|uniref:Uncharacterized protein n=1 Tax=Desulfoscipio geothermicus DSM 3669 TaxID=1121426 RepID=A0A1I6EET7_9FIRM|nr:hypothetical protein SAMN05660706_13829 [Desulfoscipio geothermicus DSM 3669]
MVEQLNKFGIPLKEDYYLSDVKGLSYLGNNFPAKIRFYISNKKIDSELYTKSDVNLDYLINYFIETNEKPNLDRAFVFFSYYEKKWGRNLSWINVIPIKEEEQ